MNANGGGKAKLHPVHHGRTAGWQGVPIRYSVYGEGEPTIVGCNGLGVSTFFWDYVVRHFAPTHRVITWEYRGHYTSGKPHPATPETLSMAANAHDLAAVLDACKVERAVLLGHSMGCQVLLEFWHLYPHRVAGLVPICGPYGHPLDTFFLPPAVSSILFDALCDLATAAPHLLESVWRPLLRSPLPDFLARFGLINAQLASVEDMAPYFEHMAKMDLQVLFLMAAAMQRHDAGPWLRHIDVPALIVAGEIDNFTPMSLSMRMRDRIPGAQMLVLPKGSHAGIIEHPELINLRLEKFLRERVEPFLAQRQRTQPRQASDQPAAERQGPLSHGTATATALGSEAA